MKRLFAFLSIFVVTFILAQSQVRPGPQEIPCQPLRFMDENGDGINDFARDYDGDGIPNCRDADWAGRQEGAGRHGAGNLTVGRQQIAGVPAAVFGKRAFRENRQDSGLPGSRSIYAGTGLKAIIPGRGKG